MPDCRITHIRKPDRFSQHEHITHVGNLDADWIWKREDVIASIDAGTNTFYVLDSKTGHRSEVGVMRPNDGRLPFLRTYADRYWNDNLLSLPQC
jgi:hypothetical protein